MSVRIGKEKEDVAGFKRKDLLFKRGYAVLSFALSEAELLRAPFFGFWRLVGQVGSSFVYAQESCHAACIEAQDGTSLFLLGHAYNPLRMVADEDEVLRQLAAVWAEAGQSEAFFAALSELTGVFVLFVLPPEGGAFAVQDCAGLMPVAYVEHERGRAFASHPQLLADVLGLQPDAFVANFLQARFNKIGIANLPGIKTLYQGVRMLTPNTWLDLQTLAVQRFYPLRALPQGDADIEKIERILQNSVKLAVQKWRCAVSMTGGVDSRLTLAAAKSVRQDLRFFSFSSNPNEMKDVLAAKEICQALGLQHEHYDVPQQIEGDEFEELAAIMHHNLSYSRFKYGPDVNKRYTLWKKVDFECEIKSHVNEISRAFYYKKLGVKRLRQPLSSRNMSNLSKRNFFDRRLLRQMDAAFAEFAEVASFGAFPTGYDESDMFYWEHRMPQWAAQTKQSFDVSHETTIIYNNRVLLEEMLRFDFEARLNDGPHKALAVRMDDALAQVGAENANAMKSWRRIWLEKAFYFVNNF